MNNKGRVISPRKSYIENVLYLLKSTVMYFSTKIGRHALVQTDQTFTFLILCVRNKFQFPATSAKMQMYIQFHTFYQNIMLLATLPF